ncbi:DEAD/DEAH box helicase [Fusobacterium sp. IOR10]|uniref:DEAD/DEAH box helicase n=1 Tax=Fusobacterium sp. IOR10 TaxID=2665157 RepID=UPI0013D3F44A|nr:DEAD/DEAH box helicase [Fusobacterium sp. IOR10]
MNYGIENTHSALKNKLVDYITSQYLGENRLLLKACKKEINKPGVLFQKPFIEANPAYETKKNGIRESKSIPQEVKNILLDMMDKRLGVFENPFSHQIEALESFYKKKDLFITTGTGSGKTECFMWPMISSIVLEAKKNPNSWEQKGVRALMLYPMNALVSDQIGRLRKMIGDPEGKFREIFYKNIENKDLRIPTFGMYTGRTPYPGEDKESKSKELVKTMEKDLVERDEKIIKKLIDIGKYPSKINLKNFVNNLKLNNHITDENDAELITRQEMQKECPDILITNYSMLEYMLSRPIEKNIWEETKRWLNEDKNNQLLLIIDEAHMYKGSSGGEVSYLIRRLLSKLNISRKKIRVILTSASIPKDGIKKVEEFACDLTGEEIENNNFEIIYGKQEKINEKEGKELDFTKLLDFDIDRFQMEDFKKLLAINDFIKLGDINVKESFSNYSQAQVFLYDYLNDLKPMKKIMKLCRGNAVSFEELIKNIFKDDNKEVAERKLEILLSLAPLAKNKENQILFPARLHMMFRGLQGLYACSNPNCGNDSKLNLGEIFLSERKDICPKCGSKIYEVVNDRHCGALFLKGYMYFNGKYENFFWNKLGDQFDGNVKEVHMYVIPKESDIIGKKDIKIGWLNSLTGKFYENDNYKDEKGYLHVAYNTKEYKGKPNIKTFYNCPKCGRSHLNISDFFTKGNEAFYNVTAEQLRIQSANIFDEEKLKRFPNAGRKVLLFSDSRQRAAKLAKDLTRAADDDAVRKIMVLAVKKLNEWAEKNDEEPNIDLLYIPFLEIAYNNNLQLFYGEEKERFKEDLKSIGNKIRRAKRKKRSLKYKDIKGDIDNPPGLYYEQLLKLLCNSYHSLSDIGLCWVEPCEEADNFEEFEEIEEIIEKKEINLAMEEFIDLFSAWANYIMKDSYSLGEKIDNEIRRNIRSFSFDKFGVSKSDFKLPKYLIKILEIERNFLDKDFKKLKEMFFIFLKKGEKDYYLKLNRIKLCYDKNQDWYMCEKCSGVFPKKILGRCAHCGSEKIEKIKEKEFSKYNFWRKPVIDYCENNPKKLITSINTEEHTAQLSHKDQREKTWSTTENYEMRFQDVQIDDEMPVDVLSCTTTMEVGIDIGSLTAIGLRNIPPRRENYQQRAGRAGRRSSAISTIVTFAESGPYDNYYFKYPKEIISGKVNDPWIDTENLKLAIRHINMVIFSEYLSKINKSMDDIPISKFYSDYYLEFSNFLTAFEIKSEKKKVLIPRKLDSKLNLETLKYNLKEKLEKIKKVPRIENEGKVKGKSLLDILFEESILPTYSFPKNVVGFYIEDKTGSKIIQKPERSLDMAISEYAPGRVIVVDKKTYKSGGIYNNYSKYVKGYCDNPAKQFFNNEDYLKELYYCEDYSCGWFGLEPPKGNVCPFCGESVKTHSLLKPWGFAPLNGESIKESQAENVVSYAEEPCYSLTPEKDDFKSLNFENIRVAKRPDQPLIILNKGKNLKGFNVCKDCGAAVPGDEEFYKVKKPFKTKFNKSCNHSNFQNVYLGHKFMTDMVVFEFKVDKSIINCKVEKNGDQWLKNSAITLAEAVILAGARILGVEFNEIKSGNRVRNKGDFAFIDIFLFDSLSSGAGYSSQLFNLSEELFNEVEKLLSECTCSKSCHNCLEHFWNQNVQNKLDRYSGLDLLRWGKTGFVKKKLDFNIQREIFKPLEKLLNLDNYEIFYENEKIKIKKLDKTIIVLVYPVMLNEKSIKKNDNTILLSDNLIKYALPEAFNRIKNIL